ncbi:MAG TPA: hypothetical protein PKA55_11855 [Rhodoblastus sp.]|nr:hypothetical protein [Rhodoblastus sp.]
MRSSFRSSRRPDGNLLALAQISALRRALGVVAVAVAFLTLHFVLDHGAAVARQAERVAAQPKPASHDTAAIEKIGL